MPTLRLSASNVNSPLSLKMNDAEPLKALPNPPRRTLTVGVTGHRPNRLEPSWIPELRKKLSHCLELIVHCWQASPSSSLSYSSDPPVLRVISALAPGSDQIVAAAAADCGYELQAVLPFHRDEYEADFADAESRGTFRSLLDRSTRVLEMDGNREEAPAAYAHAGQVTLSQCDLLIAVWNGEAAAGRGGTSEMVHEAIRGGVPVIWVRAAPPHDCQLHHEITSASWEPLTPDRLAEVIGGLINPPVDDEASSGKVYLEKKFRRKSRGRLFTIFRAITLVGGSAKQPVLGGVDSSSDQAQTAALTGQFENDYRRADALADHYGGRYRDSVVGIYAMAAAAVAMSLLEGVGGWSLASVAELVLLGSILLLMRAARRGCWHERWLSFRVLAEELRQAATLRPLGRTLRPIRVPAHRESNSQRLWVSWFARARVREAGLTSAVIDAGYLTAYRAALAMRLEGQVHYHSFNGNANRIMAHRIHILGVTSFAAAFVAVLFHAVVDVEATYRLTVVGWPLLSTGLRGIAPGLASATSYLDSLLPAIGAAFAGIGSQGEFSRIGQRSRAMSERLRGILDRVRTSPATTDAFAALAVEAADVMTAELLDWHVLFHEKGVELPV